MTRLFTLTKKNLLRFFRNPKSMGFLIGIPVMYYILIGLIFGGISYEDTSTTYQIGWVDNDSTTANYGIHPQFSLNTIYDILNETDVLNITKYGTNETAKQASISGDIIAYIYFPQGFEQYLEINSKVKIGFWNNDTTTADNYTITGLYDSLVATTSGMIEFTNITSIGNTVLNNFDAHGYDALLIINDNFLKGLNNTWNVNMSYYYRKGSSVAKNYYVTATLTALSNNYYHVLDSSSNVSIPYSYMIEVQKSTPITPIQYEVYFMQTVSPAVKSVVNAMVFQMFSGIVNTNPTAINMTYTEKSTVGKVVNSITFSAPGYLLYGPMTILSFALVVLTGEKKDGIYKRLASTEVKNWEIIMSSIIANIMLIFMQFGIGAFILWIFGWDPVMATAFDAILGVIVTVFLFSFFLLALAYALAPVFKDPDTAGGGVWIIIIPLAMVSGIFVPIELFGEGMQVVASVLPTRFAVVALQNLLLNGQPLLYPETLLNLGLLGLYSTVIFLIGIKAFNKFKK